MNEDEKLGRLRKQIEEQQALVDLEREKALISVEILESILLRIGALERRVEKLETGHNES